MDERFIRTQMLLGQEGLDALLGAHVAVFGLGGVGSYAVEALARCGVGELSLIDDDAYTASNLNRQLYATRSALGEKKVIEAKKRIADIDPDIKVHVYPLFFDERTQKQIDFSAFSYVIDAIDTVSAKLLLILLSKQAQVPVVSCMGTGNKLHPEQLEFADIAKTSVCPLARVMRRELKNRGIVHVDVLYSKEEPVRCAFLPMSEKKVVPGSVSFVPSVAGLMLAGKAIRELAAVEGEELS